MGVSVRMDMLPSSGYTSAVVQVLEKIYPLERLSM